MAGSPEDDVARDDRVNEVIASFLEAWERGESPDPCTYVARHPDIAKELSQFFADQALFQQAAGDLRDAVPAVLATPASAADCATSGHLPAGGEAPRLRYFGDYELLEEIARGGMGVVYKARQVTLNRTVAVKMILGGCLASADDVKRFRVEAEAAAQLDHPGIVPIYEVGEHGGNHYYSMGLVGGASLSARVAKGPLPAREAAEVVRAVAEAVDYAHRRGVIHRDLKPGNVLLDEHGRPRVTDFGLAKFAHSAATLTGIGQILGTPSYMPPEQAAAQGRSIGRAADVYSMGAILYCLLAGRPPFQAATPMETLLQVRQQEPLPARTLNRNVPLDLDTIALKCLEKSPAKRYSTAQELAEDLDRFLRGRPIVARRIRRLERSWRCCRRNPAVAALSSAAVVLLVASAAVSTVAYFREAAMRDTIEGQADGLRQAVVRETSTTRDAKQSAALAVRRRRDAEEQSQLLRRGLYISDMRRLQLAFETGRFVTATAIIEQYRDQPSADDLRGFEWWYWNRRLHDPRTLRPQGPASVDGKLPWRPGFSAKLAFAADGRQIVSLSTGQGTAAIWDVATGDQVNTFPLPAVDLDRGAAAFSEDTRFMACAVQGGIALFEVAAGNELWRSSASNVIDLAFSRDGSRLASAALGGPAKVWDAATGQELRTLSADGNAGVLVAFSPDCSRLAVGGAGVVQIWDMGSSQQVLMFKTRQKGESQLAFNDDGTKLASDDGHNSVVIVDAGNGEISHELRGHTNTVHAIAFSPDGARLASASFDKTVKVWDVAAGKEESTLYGHTDEVWCVAFSPDGKRIASGSADQTVRHWDATSGDDPLTIEANSKRVALSEPVEHSIAHGMHNVISVAYNQDATRIVTGGYDNVVKLWNTTTGQEIRTMHGHSGSVFSVAFSPDGSRIASGDLNDEIKVWDAETGEEQATLREGPAQRYITSGYIRCVAFSPDGERVAAGGSNGAEIWQVSTKQKLLSINADESSARCETWGVAFSPDGTRILSGARSGALTLYDAFTGEAIRSFSGHTGNVVSVAYHPDGRRIASAGSDRTVRIWDVETGTEFLVLRGHEHLVPSVAFTPDGKRIVSAEGHDRHLNLGDLLDWDYPGDLKIWDADTGQETLTLKGHSGPIISLAVSRDGSQIASTSLDGTIRIWRATKQDGP